MRHGVPMAGHMKMQEMAIATGAIEVIAVDIQCVMQGDEELSRSYHTKFITTSPKAKIFGAEHIEIIDEIAYD